MSKPVPAAAFAIALASWTMAAPASADGAIVGLMSERDVEVLAQFDTRRAAAIATATGVSDTAAVATLAEALSGEALPFDTDHDPSGDWRCRFLKLGGDPVLTVHDWFSCKRHADPLLPLVI